MRKLHFGVIGGGGIADLRTMPGMTLADNVEITAIMDVIPEKAEELKEKYGAKRCYTSEEDILKDPEVEAVYIATPVWCHARQAKLAADYGKHILLEKPIAMTVEEGEEVVRYCHEKGVKLAAGFMMRFGTHVQAMKKAIANGEIGDIVAGYSQFSFYQPYAPDVWRESKAKAGGGSAMDLGVHCIDLMEYISGMKAVRVASFNKNLSFIKDHPDYDVEDSSTILMEMENGAQFTVISNFNLPISVTGNGVTIMGTRGMLVSEGNVNQVDAGTLVKKSIAGAEDTGFMLNMAQPVVENGSDEFSNMYMHEVSSFADSVLNDKPLEVPAEDAVHVQKVIFQAYKSSEQGIICEI